jgi:hypothetical protein
LSTSLLIYGSNGFSPDTLQHPTFLHSSVPTFQNSNILTSFRPFFFGRLDRPFPIGLVAGRQVPAHLTRLELLDASDKAAVFKHTFELDMRARNYVHADQLTDATGGGGSGVGRSFNGANVASDEHGHITRPYIFSPNQDNVSSFYHCVGRFNGSHESLGLDHAQRFHCHYKFSLKRILSTLDV